MNQTTRQALGLPPLPADQAARIEAQARDLASGRYMRWPEATAHLPDLTLLPDADASSRRWLLGGAA